MELFLTVKCLKSLKDKVVDVKTPVMDDDTTTFVRAKKAVSDHLKKCSDKVTYCEVLATLSIKSEISTKTYPLLTLVISRSVSVMPSNQIKAMRREFGKIY